jgi:predicted DNA-binding protein (MmcQ/YjbR family)
MSFAALKKHAMSLPGATADIKWGADWTACVGAKMFLCGGPNPPGTPGSAVAWTGCSFKVDDHRFLELTDLPGFAPAPYLARHHWVKLSDPKALPLAELKALVERSHALVLAGLTKKLQREILGG